MNSALASPPKTTVQASRRQSFASLGISMPTLLAFLIVSLVFFLLRTRIADPDLWWHLRNGEFMWTHHAFPLFDGYSFTAKGAPWAPHEWLSEIAYYVAYRLGGLEGIFALTGSLYGLIFLGVYYLSYRFSGDVKNSFAVTLLAVLLGTVSLGPRTLLFGWLFLVVLLIILEPLRRGRPAKLWAIPPLFLVWINFHGSWLMGMIVLGTVIACGIPSFSSGQVDAVAHPRSQTYGLLKATALSVVALFINPVGYRLVVYPFDLRFNQKLNLNHIAEWKSLNFHEGMGILMIGVIVAILAAALFSRVRWRLEDVAFVALALYMSLTYSRMTFLAGILIPPLLAARCKLFLPYEPKLDKKRLNAVLIAICIAFVVLKWPSASFLDAQVVKANPTGAIAYMQSHHLQGNLFNDYVWGGYLIWASPQNPVFIDGRADIYERKGVFADYLEAMGLNNSLGILDKYKINYVLLEPKSALAYLLGNSPKWKLEYSDKISNLYSRVSALPNGT